jgi:hypothetical protein
MPIWAGVGRRVLEHAWKLHPRLGVELFGTLSEAGWRGWKMIGAPLLLRRTPDGLDHVSDLMLRLLAKLHAANKLGEVDHVWKQRVGTWVVRELEDRTLSKEKVCTSLAAALFCVLNHAQVLKLHDIAAIVPLLSGIEPTLVHVVEEALRCTDAEADYAASFANAGVALASCLRALGDSSAESWHANVDLKTWTQAIVEKWGRNALVMESLVTLVESEYVSRRLIAYVYLIFLIGTGRIFRSSMTTSTLICKNRCYRISRSCASLLSDYFPLKRFKRIQHPRSFRICSSLKVYRSTFREFESVCLG